MTMRSFAERRRVEEHRAIIAENQERLRREAIIGLTGTAIVTYSIMAAKHLHSLRREQPLDVLVVVLILVVMGSVSVRNARAAWRAHPLDIPRDDGALLILILAGGAVMIAWLYAVVLIGWIAHALT